MEDYMVFIELISSVNVANYMSEKMSSKKSFSFKRKLYAVKVKRNWINKKNLRERERERVDFFVVAC